MTDLIENFYNAHNDFATKDINSNDVTKIAIESILPMIFNNELTQQQRKCLNLKYNQNLNQTEISKKLKLKQPTVSKHISTGKKIVNDRLSYCLMALEKANKIWINELNNI